jgi:hypothetical protein
MGNPSDLFLLSNSYFIIGTSLLNPRPKDPLDEIALAKPFALAMKSPSQRLLPSSQTFALRAFVHRTF